MNPGDYRYFGCTVRSEDIALHTACAQPPSAEVDVVIAQRPVATPLTPAAADTTCRHTLAFYVPGIARFAIHQGREIHFQPDANADAQSIRLYLLGTCMGAIMHQRGQLVLHGNAIAYGDGCVIFAGASGQGKSTLAAAMLQRGYSILSDDLAVVDEHSCVQPAYPQLKLWHDSAQWLGLDVATLSRIRMQVAKYAYPLDTGFCAQPLPVRAVYLLATHNIADIVVTPMQGMDKLMPLQQHTYRKRHVQHFGLLAEHLQRCARLANGITVKQVRRPQQGGHLSAFVDRIEADMATLGSADGC